jgi:glycosyltransferase involved in cell wall biosynthesis
MKLSIVTINYNNKAGLEKTIQSVIDQTFTEFEFIIIDGGSNDGGAEVIKAHEHRLTYWVSERDKGVFHAMNKGIRIAKGDYLLMLNSGDYLHNNVVLKKIFENKTYTEDILYGDVVREAGNKFLGNNFFPDKLTFGYLRKTPLSHQATFIRKSLHEKLGLYDEQLKFSADWIFILKAICRHNATYRHIPVLTANCDCEGLTCNPANFVKMKIEMDHFFREEFSVFVEDYEQMDRQEEQKFANKWKRWKRQLKSNLKKVVKK